jgi:hypothetical protein
MTESGQTLLIVNNIQDGHPVEIRVGSKVHVEGTYVWNRHGGLIHETHLGLHKNQPEGTIEKSEV